MPGIQRASPAMAQLAQTRCAHTLQIPFAQVPALAEHIFPCRRDTRFHRRLACCRAGRAGVSRDRYRCSCFAARLALVDQTFRPDRRCVVGTVRRRSRCLALAAWRALPDLDACRFDPQWSGAMNARFCTGLLLLALLGVCAGAQARTARGKPAPIGVYLGAGCDGAKRLEHYGAWLGREPDQVIEFISWDVLKKGKTWGVQCWQKAGRKNVVYSLPMLPEDKSVTLADGAAGKFDEMYTTYAAKLVKHGFGESIIRIGWEFNADWYPWAAKRDPQSWIAYWRRIVTAMRSVPGANFKFDWCAA